MEKEIEMSLQERKLEEYRKLNLIELTEEQFGKIERDMSESESDTISDEYLDFKLWCLGMPSRQEYFAKYLVKKLHRKKAQRILEVGCGRTFRLSKILALEGFWMTCMDPEIVLPELSMEKIVCLKTRFDLHCDLSNFDFVVAQEPCDATEHVVRACVTQNKPFIMSLCGAPHMLMSGKKPKDVYEWYECLVNISTEGKIRLRKAQLNPLLETLILLKD